MRLFSSLRTSLPVIVLIAIIPSVALIILTGMEGGSRFGIVSILALGLAWALSIFFITRRINALVRISDRIAGGDYKARTGMHDAGGEFGRLAGSIDRLAVSLQNRDRELSESEVKYRAMVENINEVMYTVDEKGFFTYLSPVLDRMGGYRPEEAMGRNFLEFVHPDNAEMMAAKFNDMMNGRSLLAEFRVRVKSHEYKWVASSSTPLFKDGKFAGTMGVLSDIQGRKLAEMAARDSSERYRSIVENTHVGITIIDNTSRIIFLNARMEEITGYTIEEGQGSNFLDFTDEADREMIRERYLKRQSGEDTPSIYEVGLVRKNGERRTVEARVSVIKNSAGDMNTVVQMLDITERKITEESLLESEERYRSIVQNTHEGILIINSLYQIIFANNQIYDISGYDSEERLGMNFMDFIDDSCKAEIVERHVKRKRGEPVPSIYEAVIIRKDGGKRNVEVRVSSIVTGSGETNYIVQLLDITERRTAEEERKRLEQQILQTQKLESLGVLAGGIAHDFNNILMAVLGHADLAMMELPASSPAQESLSEIVKALRRAADLCRQMLAYSGRALFVVENLNINDLIEEMVYLLRTSISKKASLNLNLSREAPSIRGDATQIRQIVMNLITNASEALEERSGSISIATGLAMCDERYLAEFSLGGGLAAGRYVIFEVSDTGSGMDRQTMDRIFEPFFTTKFTGRGLGLAAVLGIVRGHGGACKVYSEPGKGTSFKILFPSATVSEVEEKDAVPDEDTITVSYRSSTVLLVDDEESVRSLGRRMLEKLGYNTITASDGREALSLFKETLEDISCVILDLTMPIMDGFETFRELRRMRVDIPVILSSGYTQHEVLQRFAGKGLSGFIQKPYTTDNLGNEMKRVLQPVKGK